MMVRNLIAPGWDTGVVMEEGMASLVATADFNCIHVIEMNKTCIDLLMARFFVKYEVKVGDWLICF